MQSLERPPHRLYVLVGVGDVRPVIVEPVPDAAGEQLPVVLVPEYALAAPAVEFGHAEPFDAGLAADSERFLDLDLDRQPVGIPARYTRDLTAAHGVVAAHQILDGPSKHVMDPGPAVGGGRALKEDEGLAVPRSTERLVEEPFALPGCQEFSLQLGERALAQR